MAKGRVTSLEDHIERTQATYLGASKSGGSCAQKTVFFSGQGQGGAKPIP